MKSKKAGFTLVELLAVITIIGILAALVLGVSSYASRKATEARAIADMEKLRNALEEYKVEYGAYPGDTLDALDDPEPMATANNDGVFIIEGEFLELSNFVSDVNFEDPWGSAYEYKKTSEFNYQVVSRGQSTNDPADDLDSSKGYK